MRLDQTVLAAPTGGTRCSPAQRGSANRYLVLAEQRPTLMISALDLTAAWRAAIELANRLGHDRISIVDLDARAVVSGPSCDAADTH
jgi:hypothetical protein